MSGIFKAYDIRGRYPDELDEPAARRLGMAFAAYLGGAGKRVAVGRDMRLSSPPLAGALVDGLLAAGADATDLGMVSTPLLYHAVRAQGFDGGVMVTASHLPAGLNGFKLCRAGAEALSGENGLPELRRSFEEGTAPPAAVRGRLTRTDLLLPYVAMLSSFVRAPVRNLRVCVDAGNGTAGPELVQLFGRVLAWTMEPLYLEPDGGFPHHVANPLIPSTTRDLERRVREAGADCGVAFDGDADRCGFIDEQGRRVPQDVATALLAAWLLEREPGATILYDLRSSRIVPETVRARGGRAVRCRAGHSFIKAAMRREQALFAGEFSGHYYFRATGWTDNALLAMVELCNLLSATGLPVSFLVRPLMKYSKTDEISLRVPDGAAVLEELAARYRDARQDRLDGLTVEYEDWWFNLRPSQTEQFLRLNLEAAAPGLMEAKLREVLALVCRTGCVVDA